MEAFALIISIIALIIAIVAYQKAGGRAADLNKHTEALTHVGETVAKATDSLREKTADVLERMEAVVRGTEERREAPKAREKTETAKSKKDPRAGQKR
jgi:hypothetical protein